MTERSSAAEPEGGGTFNFPDFYESAEARLARGELEIEQTQESTKLFEETFERLMHENKCHMRFWDTDALKYVKNIGADVNIRLGGRLSVDGQTYSVALEDSDFKRSSRQGDNWDKFQKSELYFKTIIFAHTSHNNCTHMPQRPRLIWETKRLWGYCLCIDNIVRRYDFDEDEESEYRADRSGGKTD